MELILTGRTFDAAEAKKLGVVNGVAAPGTSLEAARELAETVCAVSPSPVRASKQALNALDEIEQSTAANGAILGRLMRTRDFREGISAFVEKRAPKWSNR